MKLRLFFGLLAQALVSLRDNTLRTVLSVLGVTIGIAAVMVVDTIGDAGEHIVFSELETFGLRSVWVFRDRKVKDPNRAVLSGSGIDSDDYAALQAGCCPAVSRATPVVRDAERSLLVQNQGRYSDAELSGVGHHYLGINNDRLTAGRDFSERDMRRRRPVAIIGTQVQKDLFPGLSNPVGREIRIGRQRYTVIGLLQEKSRDFLSSIGSAGKGDANNRILVPYSSFQEMLGLKKQLSYLQAEAVSLDEAKRATEQIIALLERRHKQAYDYRPETMKQYIATAGRILDGVSIVGVIAASVSLLVGGMGIMNIMSTSVLERTREIGLRKAIGARAGDILQQFLLEAVFISGLGGLLGIGIGVLANVAIALLADLPLTLSWGGAWLALSMSVLVGLLSGFYPAQRAARMQPVVALRYE